MKLYNVAGRNSRFGGGEHDVVSGLRYNDASEVAKRIVMNGWYDIKIVPVADNFWNELKSGGTATIHFQAAA